MPTRTAAYCRISKAVDGSTVGVDRQERIIRTLADRLGWTVAEVYTDNDISAYSGKRRPGYERMLADLESGQRDGVVVVDTDRLTRTPAELESFIELADRLGVPLANASGDLDLSTSDGRLRARIMGAVARQESERKSERLLRYERDRAERGKFRPGKRGFGYDTDGGVIPHEADLLRQAARRVLAGHTVTATAKWLNSIGSTTTTGGQWSHAGLLIRLRCPTIAGLVVYRDEILGEGDWTPIIDRETWDRLQAVLAASRSGRGRAPRKLLSGFAVCGLCGHPVVSSGGKANPTYSCNRNRGQPGCGRVAVSREHTDRHVRDVIADALDSDEFRSALLDADGDSGRITEELAAVRARLDQATDDHYVSASLSRDQYVRIERALKDRMGELEGELSKHTVSPLLSHLTGSVRQWWDSHTDAERRALVRLVFVAVTINPATPSGPRFNPDRIGLEWRS